MKTTRELFRVAVPIHKCPHYIMVPEHWRLGGGEMTCRCDDPDHTEMAEWGYVWIEEEGVWK